MPEFVIYAASAVTEANTNTGTIFTSEGLAGGSSNSDWNLQGNGFAPVGSTFSINTAAPVTIDIADSRFEDDFESDDYTSSANNNGHDLQAAVPLGNGGAGYAVNDHIETDYSVLVQDAATGYYYLVGHVSIAPAADGSDPEYVGVVITKPFDPVTDQVLNDETYPSGAELTLVDRGDITGGANSTAFQDFVYGEDFSDGAPDAYDNDIDFDLSRGDIPRPDEVNDKDGDGVLDVDDLDDDNDGILDTDEGLIDTTNLTSNNIQGPVHTATINGQSVPFSVDIESIDLDNDDVNPGDALADGDNAHMLKSITLGSRTYSDFITPDTYKTTQDASNVFVTENGDNQNGVRANEAGFDDEALRVMQSDDLNKYVSRDNGDAGDSYTIGYNIPLLATGDSFIMITERFSNNSQTVQAIDEAGNPIGNAVSSGTGTNGYFNTGANGHYFGTSNQQPIGLSVHPLDNFVPLGTEIHGFIVTDDTANLGADGKVFVFGDLEATFAFRDSDGDGIPDHCDLDSDNDGISDLVESGANAAVVDTNNDGVYDNTTGPSAQVNDDGVPLAANGGAGVDPVDTDGDGLADFIDIDSDNDGITDYIESRASADFTPYDSTDSDNDGIIDSADTDAGGAFTTPVDSGGSAAPDYLDSDSDGDGISDTDESGLPAPVINADDTLANDANRDGLADEVTGFDVEDQSGTIAGTGVGGLETQLANDDSDDTDVDFRSVNDGIVQGGAGDDVIEAVTFTDDPDGDEVDNEDAVLAGEAPQDDIILGFDGNDTINAGDGADEVFGGGGSDVIDGGAGADAISGDSAGGTYGDGFDPANGDYVKDTDADNGTGAADTIDGGGGMDTILGEVGNDSLTGSEGDDCIEGGEGDDTIIGDGVAIEAPIARTDPSSQIDSYTGGEQTAIVQQNGEDITVTYEQATGGPFQGSGVQTGFGTVDEVGYVGRADGVENPSLTYDFSAPVLEAELKFVTLNSDEFYRISVNGQFVDLNQAIASGDVIVTIDQGAQSPNPTPPIANADGELAYGSANGSGGDYEMDVVTLQFTFPVESISIETNYDLSLNQSTNGVFVDVLFPTQTEDFDPSYDDKLLGDAGNDVIEGNQGEDTIDGGTGDDTIDGGADADIMDGGDDADTFINLTNGDVVVGGTGDSAEGGADLDTLDLRGVGEVAFQDPDGNPVANFDALPTDPNDPDAKAGTAIFTDADGNTASVDFSQIERVLVDVDPDFNPTTTVNAVSIFDFDQGSLSDSVGSETPTGSLQGPSGKALVDNIDVPTDTGELRLENGPGDNANAGRFEEGATGQDEHQLSAGRIELAFSQDEQLGGSHNTLFGRTAANDGSGEGDLRIAVENGKIVVFHGDGTQVNRFETGEILDIGDDVRVSYSWDANGTGELVVTNLTDDPTGANPTIVPINEALTLEQPGGSEPIFFGSDDTNGARAFQGDISYVALYETPVDGVVQGDDGDDLIDTDYLDDPDGDRVDNNDEVIAGEGPQADIIIGLDGNDTILAGDGEDEVFGGGDSDSIDGGAGDDVISGDGIGGTLGDGFDPDNGDYVKDSDDPNAVNAGAADTIDGGTGDDTITGEDGNDSLTGSEGDDCIEGGEGNDTIIGDGGAALDNENAPAGGTAPVTDFSIDPGWTQIGNTSSDGFIGYQPNTNFATGDVNETGEIGGQFNRQLTDLTGDGQANVPPSEPFQPYYVKLLDQPITDDNSFSFTSQVFVGAPASAEALVGFFNTQSQGANYMAAHFNDSGNDGYRLSTEYSDEDPGGVTRSQEVNGSANSPGEITVSYDHTTRILSSELTQNGVTQTVQSQTIPADQDFVFDSFGLSMPLGLPNFANGDNFEIEIYLDDIQAEVDGEPLNLISFDDKLFGNEGNDVIDGNQGDDTIEGGTGDDTITGGSGADSLVGGDDADTFVGGTDGDIVIGGAGDSAEGGEDFDTLDLTGKGDVTFEKPDGTPVANFDALDDDATDTDAKSGTAIFMDENGNEVRVDFSQIERVLLDFNPPEGLPGTETTDEDTPVTIDLVGTDEDGTVEEVTVTELPDPSEGVLFLPDGTTPVTVDTPIPAADAAQLVFVPAPNFNGDVSIPFTVTDDDGATSDPVEEVLTVVDVNDPPVATPGTHETPDNTPVTVDLVGTDEDGTVDEVTVTELPDPSEGLLTLPNGDPVVAGQPIPADDASNLTFTPAEDFHGDVTVPFTVTDDDGATSEPADEVITVLCNEPPVAEDDTAEVEQTKMVVIDVLANDTDPEDDDLRVTNAFVDPQLGEVEVLADNTVKFTPADDVLGEVEIRYVITDDDGGFDDAIVTVLVTEKDCTVCKFNAPPVAVDDDVTVDPDVTTPIDVLSNDTDPDGDDLTVVSATSPDGTVDILPDGTLNFTPTPGFTGDTTITYVIEDEEGLPDQGTVNVTVSDENDPPVATPGTHETLEDTAVVIDLVGTDPDGTVDEVTVTELPDPSEGVLTLPNGDPVVAGQPIPADDAANLTFTPAPDFNGDVTVPFTVTDNDGASSDPVDEVITVTDVNDAPTALPGTETTDEGTPVVIDLVGTDPDGTVDEVTVTELPDPSEGVLTLPNGDPVVAGQPIPADDAANLTFTPEPGFTGDVTVPFTVTDDDDATSDPADEVITVTAPTNDFIVEGTPDDDIIDETYDGDPDGDFVDNNDGENGDNDDTIIAGDGNDSILSGQGDDDVDAGPGDDTVNAGVGDDIVDGGEGEDVIRGNAGDDTLDGGDDDDTLFGGDGSDSILGGDGDDSIVSSDPDNDFLIDKGYPGLFPGEEGTPEAENERDFVDGGAGDDTIRTGDDRDTIVGGTGDDDIDGGIDDDEITGDEGDDRIVGGEGNDVIEGGVGDDTIYAGNDPDLGLDFLNIEDDGSNPFGPDLRPDNGRDTVFGGEGDDVIFGADDDDELFGEEGDDFIDGEIDDDLIDGGVGDDTLIGGQGDDTIEGGDGQDDIDGGIGDDDIDGGRGRDTIDGGDGDDSIDGGRNQDLIDGGDGDDTITGGNGKDTIDGGDGDDSIDGGTGEDSLDGGDGNDVIDGATGDDSIDGGAGDDTIDGGNGDDTITGGDGDDDLSGGRDRDLFINVNAGDVVDGNETGDDFDTLDLTGSAPVGGSLTVDLDPNNPENGTVRYRDADGNDAGTLEFTNIERVIPCFTPGTLIATPTGERKVEDLQVGDRVITRDNGIQEIRWVGNRALSGAELSMAAHLQPVLIRKGALGAGLPERDMMVSPQHRVLIANEKAALYFEEREVLVAAKHLTMMDGVDVVEASDVTYIHVMFDQHEVILSDGAWTESFQPGDLTMGAMEEEVREELLALFPELATEAGVAAYTAARRALKKHEAALLVS